MSKFILLHYINTPVAFSSLAVDGRFGDWSPWGSCGVTCGRGFRERTHHCDSPAPQYGGINCDGGLSETQPCISNRCAGNSLIVK